MSGDPTDTWKMTELVFVHTPGWCTIVLESGRMKQFPSLHPPPWDSAMSASYWSVIPHRAVTCSCRCFDSLNVSCFSDFSTFPYIFGTTTQSVLGSQGAVKKLWHCCSLHSSERVGFSLICLSFTDWSFSYAAHHHLWNCLCRWHMGRWVGHPAYITSGW